MKVAGVAMIDAHEALRLRNEGGLTWAQVGERLGCTGAGAMRAARRAGEPRRGGQGQRTIDPREVCRLRDEGLTWEDVAKMHGCSAGGARKAAPDARKGGDRPRCAYDMRADGASWREVADAAGYASATSARLAVTSYARSRGLAWPLKVTP